MTDYNFAGDTLRALHAARDAASSLGHEYIGTEHLLLGVLHDRSNYAVTTMTALGTDLRGIEAKIKEIVKVGNAPPTNAQRPYTSRAKKALECMERR